jgi:hypothetical protein
MRSREINKFGPDRHYHPSNQPPPGLSFRHLSSREIKISATPVESLVVNFVIIIIVVARVEVLGPRSRVDRFDGDSGRDEARTRVHG